MDGDRGDFAEFGKKRNVDYVFPPIICRRKITKTLGISVHNDKSVNTPISLPIAVDTTFEVFRLCSTSVC